jgi:hypothetical protein
MLYAFNTTDHGQLTTDVAPAELVLLEITVMMHYYLIMPLELRRERNSRPELLHAKQKSGLRPEDQKGNL